MSMRKDKKIRMHGYRIAAFTMICLLFLSLGGRKTAWAETYDAPRADGLWIFGNGFPLLITKGSTENTTTIKYDKDRNGTYETVLVEDKVMYDDTNGYTIYGGAQNGSVENTSITMEGGSVWEIRGGGQSWNWNGYDEVTGTTQITIKGGLVHSVNGGGDALGSSVNSVNKASILMEDGTVENLSLAGDAHSIDATNNMKEISVIIKGGTVKSFRDHGAAWGGTQGRSEITVGKVSKIQISDANVGKLQISSGWVTFENPIPENPTDDKGTKLYPVELDLVYNGSPYLDQKIDNLITAAGKTITLKNSYTYDPDNKNTKARITAWLPQNTQIDAATATSGTTTISFVNQGSAIKAGGSKTSGTLTNLVKIPALKDPQPTYNGKSISGLTGLSPASSYEPYTITGDNLYQINAGTYKTTFTLRTGYQWADNTTKAKTLTWSIQKATQSAPKNLQHKDESGYQKNDGSVLGLAETMEYSVDKNKWISLSGKLDKNGNLNGLAPGTYYFRYAETVNLKASGFDWVTINAAKVYTLSLYDYETTELLDSIPADVVEGKSKVLIPDKYKDYALFSYKGSKDYIRPVLIDAEGRGYVSIGSDSSLLALPAVYEDAKVSFDLKDSKTISITLLSESVLSSSSEQKQWEDRIARYFYDVLQYMIKEGAFGNQSNLTSEEIKQYLCDNTFYVTPCAADSDLLSQEEVYPAKQTTKAIRVIPHISLTPQKDSVFAVHVDIKTGESKSEEVTVSFTGQKNDKVYTVTALDLGGTPDAYKERILLGNYPIKNVVYNTTVLTVKYGSGEESVNEPYDKPVEDPSTGTQKDGSGKITDPGSQPSGQPGTSDSLESYPVMLVEQERIITEANTDKGDPKGACFRYLKPRLCKVKKHELTLSWKRIKKADGYVIYGAKCGSKMKRIKTITKPSKHSVKIQKLKSNTYYKYIVVAYQNTDAGEVALYTSTSVHAATSGGRKNNPLGVKLKKSKLNVKGKKSVKIRGTIKKKGKVQFHIAKLRYESLNSKIATVNQKGKVKGKKKGKTSILVYTQNGIWKKMKITVK